MNIRFLEREKRQGYLDPKSCSFDCLYLIAIKNGHPELWNDFKEFIEMVEREAEKAAQVVSSAGS